MLRRRGRRGCRPVPELSPVVGAPGPDIAGRLKRDGVAPSRGNEGHGEAIDDAGPRGHEGVAVVRRGQSHLTVAQLAAPRLAKGPERARVIDEHGVGQPRGRRVLDGPHAREGRAAIHAATVGATAVGATAVDPTIHAAAVDGTTVHATAIGAAIRVAAVHFCIGACVDAARVVTAPPQAQRQSRHEHHPTRAKSSHEPSRAAGVQMPASTLATSVFNYAAERKKNATRFWTRSAPR